MAATPRPTTTHQNSSVTYFAPKSPVPQNPAGAQRCMLFAGRDKASCRSPPSDLCRKSGPTHAAKRGVHYRIPQMKRGLADRLGPWPCGHRARADVGRVPTTSWDLLQFNGLYNRQCLARLYDPVGEASQPAVYGATLSAFSATVSLNSWPPPIRCTLLDDTTTCPRAPK
jgi:hypothetical protein